MKTTTPKTSTLADAVRRHNTSAVFNEHELEILDMLDVADREAVPVLIRIGGLFAFHHDHHDGLPEVIGRIADRFCEAPESSAAFEARLGALSQDDDADAYFGHHFHQIRAAYCLGLAIGRRLS